MKVKTKLFVFALILSLIFSIATVTAQENITFDQSESQTVSIQSDNVLNSKSVTEDETLSSQTDKLTLNQNRTVTGTDFSSIQNTIDEASDGDTIFLNAKNYIGSEPIKVNKQLTIIGSPNLNDNSHSILDSRGQSRIMEITANNVIIKGITFINAYSPPVQKYNERRDFWYVEITNGGAISIDGVNCTINDCNFINNSASNNGGAIFINGPASNSNINNCNFIKNHAIDAGCVFSKARDVKITNSNFTYNTGDSSAAIEAWGDNFILINGLFENNRVDFDGGAIRYSGFNCSIINSTFINNSANRDGGSIIGSGSNATLYGNIIGGSYTLRDGGAIYISAGGVVIKNNKFNFNNAERNGDNILIRGNNNYILNNKFCDSKDSSMGIYEQNPGSTIIENNEYGCGIYEIEINESVIGFAGTTIQIPVSVYDFVDDPASGTVTLNGYGDYRLVKGKATFIITLPSTPTVFNTFVIYEDSVKSISIEAIANDSITGIMQNQDDDKIMVNLAIGAAGTVIVNIDGINYFAEVKNGTAIVEPAGLVNGQYVAIILYSGDDKYSNQWTIAPITIKHSPVYKITGNKDITVPYTGNAVYKVLITRDDKAVGAGESVTVNFNGKNTVVKTDSNGYATLNLDTDAKINTYVIKTNYKSVSIVNKVKITQIIKASDKKVKKSAKVTKIKITLNNGKALGGKKLTVKFNGKKYNMKTNSKGIALWKVKKSMVKKLKVGKKVKYTVTYGKDSLTKQITIKK